MSAALVALLAWAAYGVLGPIVLQGKSARHTALAVWMHRADPIGNHLPSVRVQEVGEWRLCKIIGVISALPGLIFVAHPAHQFALTVVPMLLCDALTRKIPALDYAGHGAEIISAERAGLAGYREAEIERMRRFDRRQSMTTAEIEAALTRWHWLARVVAVVGRV